MESLRRGPKNQTLSPSRHRAIADGAGAFILRKLAPRLGKGKAIGVSDSKAVELVTFRAECPPLNWKRSSHAKVS